jgi:hypothetical protein
VIVGTGTLGLTPLIESDPNTIFMYLETSELDHLAAR